MDTISEIKQRIGIAELAAKLRIQVKGIGNKLWAHSIFRTEKIPSMLLDRYSNTFHDFGNGEHGDVIDLYMHYYGLSKHQAINELKKLVGIDDATMPIKSAPERITGPYRPDLSECLSADEKVMWGAEQSLHKLQLFRMEKNTEVFEVLYSYCNERSNPYAEKYLMIERRISCESIEKFRLFSIQDYQATNKYLSRQFTMDQLQRSGLYNEHGNMIFYRHRILIPYLYRGKIVYLRARYFDENNSSQTSSMKYLGLKNDTLGLNTPKRFFNLDILKNTLAGAKLYVTEGEFDAIVIDQLGFPCVGIPGAGNLPPEGNFKRLSGYSLVYVGDNDAAGKMLFNGYYIDNNGEGRHKEKNLRNYCHKLGIKLFIKELPTKDANEYLVNVCEG